VLFWQVQEVTRGNSYLQNMRVLFVGASSFGFDALLALRNLPGIEIAGVVSSNQKFSISYNKEGVQNVLYKDFGDYCSDTEIPFYRMAENMKEPGLAKFIADTRPELGIVIGWYHMIPGALLSAFPFTGIHASLLPDYSGGAPLVWAMINGEQKTGVSYFYFDKGVDSGDIIGQEEIQILDSDNIKTLYERVTKVGIDLLKKYVPMLAAGDAPRIVQDHSKRRIYPQRSPSDGEIDWSWDAKRIRNFIRAQTKPYPGAWTIIDGKKVIIWDADIQEL
jgi:methionyl-tRNA formyltransferase